MTLEADDLACVDHALSHPEEWTDTEVEHAYQREFAAWNASGYAFAFAQGRVALSAAIHALGLQPGDEVVVPGYTCIAVPNAFRYAGIVIRYCDIELDTFGPDIGSVMSVATSRTKALLVHHLYGMVCRDFDRLLEFARQRGIPVIEDCAHATGAFHRGRRVGNFGDVAFYSSEQSKVFCTFNGGMAVTNDAAIGARLGEFQRSLPCPDAATTRRLLRNVQISYELNRHPRRRLVEDWLRYRYRNESIVSTTTEELSGIRPARYLQRLAPPLAALGRNQLRKVDRFNARRRATAARWRGLCAAKGYPVPLEVQGSDPVYLRYPVLVPRGKKFDASWAVREFGAEPGHWFVGEHHPLAAPLRECPNARYAVEHCVNLPTLLL